MVKETEKEPKLIYLRDMNMAQFQEFFESLNGKQNFLSIDGVVLSSCDVSMKELIEFADKVLEKHKDFLEWRRELKIKSSASGIG